MAFTGKLGTSESELGNIVPGRGAGLTGGSGSSFTADAVLLSTHSSTFTADAAITGGAVGSFTADADLLSTLSGTFVADSVVKSSISQTFTADAVVAAAVSTATFTADSVLKVTIASIFTSNSVLKSTISRTFNADAALETPHPTFTANSVLLKTTIRTFLANSDLQTTQGPISFTADAFFGDTPAEPVLIFEDTFTRTTSPGDLGTPSGGGYESVYFSFPDDPAEFYVDGQLIVPESVDGDQELGFYFQPHSPEFEVTFDFLTNINGFYSVWGPQVYDPAGTGSFKYYDPHADISDNSGTGTSWFITSGYDGFVIKTLDVDTMYRARVQVIGKTVKIRVWNPATESEPLSWDTTGTQANSLFSWDFSRAGFLVDWNNTPANEGRLDNIQFYRLGEDTRGYFTADAVITQGGYQFTADAVLLKTNSRTLTANAVIALATGQQQFTADAYLISLVEIPFTADAVITPLPNVYAFYANAVLEKPASSEGTITVFRKSKTIRIAQRRPRAASNFIPPKSPDNDKRDKDTGIAEPPCLPPCPGDSSLASNATTIRTSVIRCQHASFYLWTPDNRLGLGDRSIDTWHDHTDAHNGQDDTYRMWVQYGNIPTGLFEMHAKLAWYWDDESTIDFPEFSYVPYGTPVTVEVYANVSLPPTQPDVPLNFGGDESWWDSGSKIGTLSFKADAGGFITDPLADHGWQWQQRRSKIVIDPGFLTTSTFKFKLSNETDTLGAKIKAPNLEITINGLS